MTAYAIIDTNRNVTARLPALKADGIRSIGRYIAAGLTAEEKVVKAAEAHAIAQAGLRLFLIYEIGGRPSGLSVGERDGSFAASYAKTVGAPAGACLYYTVDYDAPASDMPAIMAAFRTFRGAVSPTFRVGAYASGYVCGQLFAAGLVEKRWLTCSRGFTGTRAAIAAGAYDILQAVPQATAGLDSDPDTLHIANGDIGDFVPFASAP